jgi:hypothetical protein
LPISPGTFAQSLVISPHPTVDELKNPMMMPCCGEAGVTEGYKMVDQIPFLPNKKL